MLFGFYIYNNQSTDQTSRRSMMSSDIASCWSLGNSSALSCLQGILHMLGLIHKVALPELCHCSMVNVTRACMHVPFHPLICSWAAAEGENVSETAVDIYNCKATHSLVYFNWTAFFNLSLCACPFWSIDLCMSSSRRWECELTSIIARQLTHSLTHI